jgi:hypothetical protein
LKSENTHVFLRERSMNREIVDIMIRDTQGRAVAVVELKNRENLSRDIAVVIRRNLLTHSPPPSAPYFLLLSQDAGFLWKGVGYDDLHASPTSEFPMKNLVSRYLPGEPANVRLRESQFELLILQWLTDLTRTPSRLAEEPEKSLARSGFIEAIRNAGAAFPFRGWSEEVEGL